MGRQHRILVVEDDPPIRSLLIDLFQDEGYQVRGAANGRAALDALDWQPDLILLDLMMPVMDGPTFRARQLEQSNGNGAAAPIIVLTARRGMESEIEAMRAAALVTKPFDQDDLIAMAGSVLADTARPHAPQSRA